MYLKRLEIQGFKSFAKHTVLEFEPGVTSIVGPNGSGKSNVADCLRWVLGEQSAKLMRGKKSEDVIFAGSDKRPRMGFAEVVATFDNSDRKIPVDASEVGIGRRIDRNGESEYLLNGNKVRLLDIVDLVLKSNIGTSRYTVIGQGTIDQMILAGPSEVKNLIDEASGVKTYYIKRERTLRRLEQTAQNLMRAEDLISELEPRVKSLRRQAKRMEAREEIQIELRGYQKQYLGGNYWHLRSDLNATIEKLNGALANRTAIESQISSHLANIERLERERTEELAKYQDRQHELQKLQSEKNGYLETLSLVRGKMQSQKTGSGDATSLRIESHTLQQRYERVQEELRSARETVTRLTEQSATYSQQIEAVNDSIQMIYEQLATPSVNNWEELEKALDSLDAEIEKYWEHMRDITDVSMAIAQTENIRSQWQRFRDMARMVKDHPSQGQAHQDQLRELSNQKESITASLNTIAVELSKTTVSVDFLTRQSQELEQEKLRLDLELKKADSGSPEEFLEQMVAEEKQVQSQIDTVSQKIEAVNTALSGLYQAEARFKESIANEDQQFRNKNSALSAARDIESGLQVEKARKESAMESLTSEMMHALGEVGYKEVLTAPLPLATDSDLPEKIEKLQHQLELIGGIDELTMQEYRETESRYSTLTAQVEDLQKGMNDLRAIMDELDTHIKTAFNEAFHKVQSQFEQYFRTLFNGGRAYLSLIRSGQAVDEDGEVAGEENAESDGEDTQMRPEEKVLAKYEKASSSIIGVEIKATPPGKKLASIQALSGGERALTSIALLCSLLSCFPSPFVVLDEVDAALDESNTIRFGQIIGTLSHQTQFLTITHNRETMAQSNTLYGVTMGDDGVSKLLSIKFDQATAFAK